MIPRIILVCLCFIVIPFQAMACSCTNDSFTDQASLKNINKAELIFEGSFVSIKDAIDAQYFSEVSFRIDTPYKGTNETQSVMAYVDTKTSCGITLMQLEKQTLFMLYTHKGKYVLAGQCGSYITDADRIALKRGDYLPK